MEFAGRESVAYLGYLYCQIERRSEEDLEDWNSTKFRSLWDVNGWKEMGSHEEGNLVFLFELLVCNSLGEWDFLLSFCNFFSKIPSLFAEMILITLEFHDEKTLYGMISYMVETLDV